MLKANLHDLDDDLPAPYDQKVVQKVIFYLRNLVTKFSCSSKRDLLAQFMKRLSK